MLRLENIAPIDEFTAESAVFVITLIRHFAVFVFTRRVPCVDTKRLYTVESRFSHRNQSQFGHNVVRV